MGTVSPRAIGCINIPFLHLQYSRNYPHDAGQSYSMESGRSGMPSRAMRVRARTYSIPFPKLFSQYLQVKLCSLPPARHPDLIRIRANGYHNRLGENTWEYLPYAQRPGKNILALGDSRIEFLMTRKSPPGAPASIRLRYRYI